MQRICCFFFIAYNFFQNISILNTKCGCLWRSLGFYFPSAFRNRICFSLSPQYRYIWLKDTNGTKEMILPHARTIRRNSKMKCNGIHTLILIILLLNAAFLSFLVSFSSIARNSSVCWPLGFHPKTHFFLKHMHAYSVHGQRITFRHCSIHFCCSFCCLSSACTIGCIECKMQWAKNDWVKHQHLQSKCQRKH